MTALDTARDLARRGEIPVVFLPSAPGSQRRRWRFKRTDILAAIDKWTISPNSRRRPSAPAPSRGASR